MQRGRVGNLRAGAASPSSLQLIPFPDTHFRDLTVSDADYTGHLAEGNLHLR